MESHMKIPSKVQDRRFKNPYKLSWPKENKFSFDDTFKEYLEYCQDTDHIMKFKRLLCKCDWKNGINDENKFFSNQPFEKFYLQIKTAKEQKEKLESIANRLNAVIHLGTKFMFNKKNQNEPNSATNDLKRFHGNSYFTNLQSARGDFSNRSNIAGTDRASSQNKKTGLNNKTILNNGSEKQTEVKGRGLQTPNIRKPRTGTANVRTMDIQHHHTNQMTNFSTGNNSTMPGYGNNQRFLDKFGTTRVNNHGIIVKNVSTDMNKYVLDNKSCLPSLDMYSIPPSSNHYPKNKHTQKLNGTALSYKSNADNEKIHDDDLNCDDQLTPFVKNLNPDKLIRDVFIKADTYVNSPAKGLGQKDQYLFVKEFENGGRTGTAQMKTKLDILRDYHVQNAALNNQTIDVGYREAHVTNNPFKTFDRTNRSMMQQIMLTSPTKGAGMNIKNPGINEKNPTNYHTEQLKQKQLVEQQQHGSLMKGSQFVATRHQRVNSLNMVS